MTRILSATHQWLYALYTTYTGMCRVRLCRSHGGLYEARHFPSHHHAATSRID